MTASAVNKSTGGDRLGPVSEADKCRWFCSHGAVIKEPDTESHTPGRKIRTALRRSSAVSGQDSSQNESVCLNSED